MSHCVELCKGQEHTHRQALQRICAAKPIIAMGLQGDMCGTAVHCAPTCSPLLPHRFRHNPSLRQTGHLTHCSAQTLSRSYSGLETAGPRKGHHFLHIDDFSKEELSNMLSTARTVKDRLRNGDNSYRPFEGKSMAMIFTKPSMRTRVSFETVSICRFVHAEGLHGSMARKHQPSMLNLKLLCRGSSSWEVMQYILDLIQSHLGSEKLQRTLLEC